MGAYVPDYVTLLTKTWSDYVTMCFFLVYPSGKNPGSQAKPLGKTSPQPRQVRRRTARPRHSTRQTQNGHFRRQIQSSLASERSILEPKGTKKHPTKNSRAFPLVFGVKNRTMRSAISQQKIDERFPPSEGLKWQFRSASDQKNAQKKNEHSAVLTSG